MRRGLTIRRQLSTLVLLVVLPLAVAIAYATYSARQDAGKAAVRTSTQLATLTASSVHTFLADTRAEMTVLASRPQVRNVDGANCDPMLSDVLRLRRYLANVTTTGLDGQIVCSVLPAARGGLPSVAGSDWFRSARRSGRFDVGEPFLGPISHRWVSVLTVPITDRGVRTGYLSEPVDLVRFQELFARLAAPSAALVTLVSRDGRFVARSQNASHYVGTQAPRGFGGAPHREGHAMTGVDGVERVYASVPVAGTEWIVSAGIPTSVAYGPSGQLITTLVVISATLVGLALLLALIAGRWIALPIQALARRARQIAENRPSTPTRRGGPREVKEAVARFEEMLTVQHDSARQLTRSEERFRQGFDNSPIGMSLIDPGSARYLRVNAAFARLVGRTQHELLGLGVRDVTVPDDIPQAIRTLSMLASGELSELTGEKRYLRPDGSVVWGALNVSRALNPDGTVDVLFAHVVDITDRKARERSLQRQLGEVQWLTEITQAFEDDRFELHAQPIVEVASGRVVQHELLIRMRDRGGTLIPPGEFLPAAEKYGAIREIDRWVVTRAAELAAGGLVVGLNVSGVSLCDPALFTHVKAELERTGADPSRLIFEITETALIEAGERAIPLAAAIRDLGCEFALDDFGTGYGGFHLLKTLPLDYLKIDQEFVREAVRDEEDRHVIEAVVTLAKGFGLRTVAEGVEDHATLDLLAEMDVDFAQGFLLGRPMPMDPDPAVGRLEAQLAPMAMV